MNSLLQAGFSRAWKVAMTYRSPHYPTALRIDSLKSLPRESILPSPLSGPVAYHLPFIAFFHATLASVTASR